MSITFQIRKSAFTLIELLVVVAIIALLISILLPSLSQARAMARSVACQSNLRQIGLGAQMYTDDYEQVYPDVQGFNNDTGWSTVLGPYLGHEFEFGNPDTNQVGVYRCPSDDGYLEDPWYVRNYPVTYAPHQMMSNAAWDHWGRYYWLKQTMVPQPTEFQMYLDVWPDRYAWSVNTDWHVMLPFRHLDNTANMVMLDGHAETVTEEEYEWEPSDGNWASLGF